MHRQYRICLESRANATEPRDSQLEIINLRHVDHQRCLRQSASNVVESWLLTKIEKLLFSAAEWIRHRIRWLGTWTELGI